MTQICLNELTIRLRVTFEIKNFSKKNSVKTNKKTKTLLTKKKYFLFLNFLMTILHTHTAKILIDIDGNFSVLKIKKKTFIYFLLNSLLSFFLWINHAMCILNFFHSCLNCNSLKSRKKKQLTHEFT